MYNSCAHQRRQAQASSDRYTHREREGSHISGEPLGGLGEVLGRALVFIFVLVHDALGECYELLLRHVALRQEPLREDLQHRPVPAMTHKKD